MRAGFPGGSREKTRFGSGGDRVGCLTTSTPAGTAASTHAHASSRWSAGRFAHRSSPRTARRAGTCVDANASASAEGRWGGEGAGSWSGGRATGDPLDETTGAPPRPRRSASPRARPSRARGASRTHRRTPPTARSRRRTPSSSIPRPCARRSDAVGFKPSAGGAHASPSRIAMASADRRDVSSAAPFSARGTPSRGSLRARHSARARWAFEPPGSRASRCRVATSPSRWSSRCSRRPSRARPPTRASSSTRPPPRRPRARRVRVVPRVTPEQAPEAQGVPQERGGEGSVRVHDGAVGSAGTPRRWWCSTRRAGKWSGTTWRSGTSRRSETLQAKDPSQNRHHAQAQGRMVRARLGRRGPRREAPAAHRRGVTTRTNRYRTPPGRRRARDGRPTKRIAYVRASPSPSRCARTNAATEAVAPYIPASVSRYDAMRYCAVKVRT